MANDLIELEKVQDWIKTGEIVAQIKPEAEFSQSASPLEFIGYVDSMEGSPTIKTAHKPGEAQPLMVGDPVYSGQIIKTDDNSSVHISGDANWGIPSNTEVEIPSSASETGLIQRVGENILGAVSTAIAKASPTTPSPVPGATTGFRG
jgi:hypothetical protein